MFKTHKALTAVPAPDADTEIIKSRSIIQSCYQLTVGEHRLITSCIHVINDRTESNRPITIHVDEFAKAWNITRQTAHSQLMACVDKLWDRVIHLPVANKAEGFDTLRWIQRKMSYENGVIQLHFSDVIYKALYQIADDVRVPTLLSTMSKFDCNHSHRLYDVLLSLREGEAIYWQWEVSLDDFRAILDLQGAYPRWVDLKKWVVEPAFEEIDKYSALKVVWQPTKEGRAITGLKITVEQRPIPVEQTPNPSPMKTKITDDFEVQDMTYQILQEKGLDLDFINSEIKAFILYYTEKGKVSDTWQTLFMQHCLKKHTWNKSGQQHDMFPIEQPKNKRVALKQASSEGIEGFFTRVTDRNWAN